VATSVPSLFLSESSQATGRRRLGTFRRASGFLLAASLFLISCGRERAAVEYTDEENAPLASTFHASDPRASGQILGGFHGIESQSWRWTEGKFSLLLLSPPGAAEKGATLWLTFAIPETVISKLKSVNLSANAGGVALPPESYSLAGQYTFSRDIPASAFRAPSLRVDFALDKYLPPEGADARELGVIVTAAGLDPK
jgi:hypothetical protein